jgi:hypothetical protein
LNHNIRFGTDDLGTKTKRRSSFNLKTLGIKHIVRRKSSFLTVTGIIDGENARYYEDVLDNSILSSPIVDVCIIQKGEEIPDGYFRIAKTINNKKADLNHTSGGSHIYLCIKKQTHVDDVAISNLVIIYPDSNEIVPPGYLVVKRGKVACNLNSGTSANRIYLCYKRDKTGNPITDFQVIYKNEECPINFSLIDVSPSGIIANINAGTNGKKIHLCYKQRLNRLLILQYDETMFRPTSGKYDNLTLSSSPSYGSAQNLSSSSSQNLLSHEYDNGDDESIEDEVVTSKFPFSNLNGNLNGKEDYTIDIGDDVSLLSNDRISTFSNDKDMSDSNEDGYSDQFSILTSPRIVTGSNGLVVSVITRRALHALLSSFYVRHGLMSQIALECISNLLIKTKFFDNESTNSSALSTTLIDITVRVLCDRFEFCIESECDDILNVLVILIKKTKGELSLITIQILIQSLSFLCNYYSSKSDWLRAGFKIPHTCIISKGSNGEEILEWIEISSLNVLNKLIRSILNRTENGPGDVAMYLPDTEFNTYDYTNSSESFTLIHSFVYDFIEEVIDIVEVSHLSEESLGAISKQSTTILSTSFWQQIGKLSLRLFKEKDSDLRNAFVCLCSICKLAWSRVRVNEHGKATPRDIGGKLLALSSILEFCNNSGESLQRSKVFGYLIRRLVVPVLLNNISYSLIDSSVFSMILKIITSLWNYWRFHVRLEFANLTDQLIIKVLQASPAKIKPIYQMIVLDEVVQWFSQPQLLLEMFVNFDMDQRFVSQNEFSHLVRAVCLMARRTTTANTTTCHRRPSMNDFTLTDPSYDKITATVREVHLKALEQICRIAKTLMDATGHSYLISQDSNFRDKATGVGTGWEDDSIQYEEDGKSRGRTVSNVNYLDNDIVDAYVDNENRSLRSNSNRSVDNDNEFLDNDNDVIKTTGNNGTGIKFRRAKHQQAEDMLRKAIEIYKQKESLKKAVEFLINNGFMPDTPQEIARFLRVYKNSFDPSAIGDFLGEGGVSPKEEEYWSQIRFRYTRAVSFVEMEIEPALRLYLTGCGFRMPGEGQKVDRFVEVFVKAYWLDNSGTQYCPFRHPDTVHLTGYAIIMLNTDLHRASLNKDKKSGREYKKMTKEQFINQLRGSDQGEDIDKDYLSRIYENILNQPIELAVESNENGSASIPSSAPVSNNNDVVLDEKEEKLLVKEISRGIRNSEDLLRVMSPFHYKFQLTGVDTNISLDLVSFMYETVWFHFHAIIESLLKPTKNDFNPGSCSDDIYVTFSSLDILCYALTSAIFLDLKVERMAFAEQLLKFKSDFEKANEIIINLSYCGKKELDYSNWFDLVEKASPDNAMETIAIIHKLLVVFKTTIQENAAKDAFKTVLQRIEKKSYLSILINNSYFVKEEDIFKKNRTGKLVKYHFFLFSDHLIYSHLSITGDYKIHSSLSLSLMYVSDDFNDCSLYINHPVKCFTIVFTSKSLKNEWLSDLQYTIESCNRKERLKYFNSNNKLSEEGKYDDNQLIDVNHPYKTPLKDSNNKKNIFNAAPLSNQSIQINSNVNIDNNNHGNNSNLTNDTTSSPTLIAESSPSKETI